MGRSVAWTPKENTTVAKAFIAASEERSADCGTGQDTQTLWNKVMEEIAKRAPVVLSEVQFRYHNRKQSAVQKHFNKNIKADVLKFNDALRIVYMSHPTGSSQQQKVNMAIAIHLGKTSRREYGFRDFNPLNWNNHEAWLMLRSHPKFLPTRDPNPTGNDSPIKAEDNNTGADNPSLADVNNETLTLDSSTSIADSSLEVNSAPAPANNRTVITTTPLARDKSRPAGKGRSGTKALERLEEHRTKKRKAIQELTDIQAQKLQSQNKYMKFTMLKWRIENCTDPDKQEKYQDMIDKIIEGMVSDEEEPLLELSAFAQTQTTQRQEEEVDDEDDNDDAGFD